MRFLCLCGAYGSSDKFAVQLAPLVQELESDGTAELHFIHGPVAAHPPKGFEDFFGLAPYYRFIDPGKTEQEGDDVLDRIRNFPEGATSEDQMRELMKLPPSAAVSAPQLEDQVSAAVYNGHSNGAVEEGSNGTTEGVNGTVEGANGTAEGANGTAEVAVGGWGPNYSAQRALAYLYDIMERDGPFGGIIGYSEGATVAATLLLHEQRRFETEGRKPMFKMGVFFAGWPPMSPDLDSIVLADESDLTITIPTCHIIGSLDPYLAGSIALYNICDMDTAYLFDHAKGHTLPRDKETVHELGDKIREMIATMNERDEE